MRKGQKASLETKEKLRISHFGFKVSEETKKKISEHSPHKGHPELSPFYGKHLSEEHKKNISIALKGKTNSGQFKKGMTSWLYGTKGIAKANSGTFKPGHWKGKKLTKEEIRKKLAPRKMSSFEIRMQKIIDKNGLPYKFVGNGEFFIERKNPDFVNINGQKIAIEVYYKRHKEIFRGNVDEWKSERSKIFNKYGWKLLFFDETQINENYVLNILKYGDGLTDDIVN